MDGGDGDWDLSAVVRGRRSCRDDNNGESRGSGGIYSVQCVADDHGFRGQQQLLLPESRDGHKKRYFGLEEVVDRFVNRGKERGKEDDGGSGRGGPQPGQKTIQSPAALKSKSRRGPGKEVRVVEVAREKVEEWDGWVWRKYGTKKVCDSPHTKSYYRCSHEGNKCPAKKHAQQSLGDETKFIVTYRGQHNHLPPVQSNATKRRKRNTTAS